MKTQQIVDDHIIYGSWDDTHGYEVLVHYHPNGTTCHVFVMGGADYGGGIVKHQKLPAKQVDELHDACESDYDFWIAVQKLMV